MPRWSSSVMRGNPLRSSLMLVLASCMMLPAYAQLGGPARPPIQTESSPSTSAADLPGLSSPTLSNSSAVLSVDEAFRLTGLFEGDSVLLLSWDIAPGHYLYRDQLEFADANGHPVAAPLPPSIAHTDEYFGETFIYLNSLQIRFPRADLARSATGEYVLQLRFQGCAEDRYCYPPTHREIRLTLPE